jgi:hypothetical protein
MGPGTRRARGLVAASLVLALATIGLVVTPASGQGEAGAAGDAANPYVGRVGMNSHMVWYDLATIEATYQSQIQGGVTHTREDFLWEFIEPTNGQFNWTRTDTLMTAASHTGMEVYAILAYSALWASSRNGQAHAYPASNVEYAEYAAAVTRRYGLGGTFWSSHPELEPQPVRAVEIWNEPSGYWFNEPGPDPARYASLALAASEAIHRIDPAMTVLIDGTLVQVRRDGAIRNWIQEVLAAEPRLHPHIGAFSSHPYPYPQDRGPYAQGNDARWDFSQVALIRQVTSDAGVARPIWITEVGWSTATAAPGTVSEAAQAQFLVQAVERALTEYGSFVPRIYLYSFDRDSNDQTDREGFFGVRHRDGTPKPAWTALRALLAQPAPAPTPTTTAPTTPVTAAPATPTQPPEVRLGPSRMAVRVFGSILYYDLG